MKKQMLALLTLIAAFVGGSGLQGSEWCDREGNFYVGGFAGANFLHQDAKKVGFAGGVSLGYEFENHIRLEGEFAYRRNQLASIHADDFDLSATLQTYSTMVNVLYDIDLGCRLTPYVGVGLGYAWNTVNIDVSSPNSEIRNAGFHANDKGSFAYQGIAGIAYNLSEKTSVGLEYRYFSTSNPYKIQNASSINIKDHAVAISLRQKF